LFKFSNNIIVKTFRQIRELLPSHLKKNAFWVFVLLIISSIVEFLGLALLVPLFKIVVDFETISRVYLLNSIYEYFNFESTKAFSIFLAVCIGIIFLFKNVFLMIITHHQIKFSFKLFNFYSTKSLQYYFNSGYSSVKSSDANTIVRNIAFIPKMFTRSFVIPYLNLINDLFIVIIIIAVLVFQNPFFVLLLLAVLFPFFLLFYFLIRKRIQRLEKVDLALQPKISRTIFQVINGYLDTLVNKAFVKLGKRNAQFVDEMCDNGTELMTLKSTPQKMVEVTMVFSLITIVCFGLYYFDDTSDLIQAMAFFGIAAFKIMPSINRILMSLVLIKGYDYIYDYLKPVSDFAKTQLNKKQKHNKAIEFVDAIEFKNIHFSYPDGDNVFNDFSIQIKKHETIGIIGPSGSGKSTLMLLMLGVIFPDRGEVSVDGVKLEGDIVELWHDLVGIVPQEVFIIDGSIKENITLCGENDEVNENALKRAVELSSLNDFISQQPKGVDSILEDKGNNLSGGQKQRIAIARAVYNGSQVIVFDEATSSLDIETEKEIKNSILTLQKEGYTLVIIAHRYTTLAHCDKILEINKNSHTTISKEELKSRMEDLF
jgi:ABC-type bacteriocin/lantibiotic exporter with double-glycine peptidase domain